MKKSILPLLLIIASVILIIVNLVTSENYDRGFWMRSLSSILLIFAMILTIRSQKIGK
ncbi:hypothetical protein [Kordia periserrulae]|uniref:hypothetical protein n=1 Tax=Kordia periserrulae TaxID=701523 RepID=UPI001304A723|nr:hypothetical protein [Kordia periserrulae]